MRRFVVKAPGTPIARRATRHPARQSQQKRLDAVVPSAAGISAEYGQDASPHAHQDFGLAADDDELDPVPLKDFSERPETASGVFGGHVPST
jgi:hypothetical protein